MRVIALRGLAAGLALLLAACGTPGAVTNENVGALRSGIAAADRQSQLAFDAANKLAREQSIAVVLADPDFRLSEADFPLPAPPEATQKWEQAFDILDEYGAALQSLVDPARAGETGARLEALATTLNGPSLEAGIPAGVAGAFSALGRAIMRGLAEKKATEVMRRTDAAFSSVVGDMASAIGTGASDAGSLQNSVAANWNASVLGLIENDYSKLAPADAEARRAVIDRYLAALGARDAQLASLAQLRQSLLALGEAHSAAARGSPGDALFWIQRIDGWLDDVKARSAAVAAGGPEKEPGK
jgi:hypothetical protein